MVEQLQVEEAVARLGQGAVMVDVRSSEERAAARIPETLFIPLNELAGRMDELPRDKPLILQCAAGMRSQQAAMFLEGQGFEVANLMHGIQGWHRMGQPIEQ